MATATTRSSKSGGEDPHPGDDDPIVKPKPTSNDPTGVMSSTLADALARFQAAMTAGRPPGPDPSSAGMFPSPSSPYNSLSDQIKDSFIMSRSLPGYEKPNPNAAFNMARYAFAPGAANTVMHLTGLPPGLFGPTPLPKILGGPGGTGAETGPGTLGGGPGGGGGPGATGGGPGATGGGPGATGGGPGTTTTNPNVTAPPKGVPFSWNPGQTPPASQISGDPLHSGTSGTGLLGGPLGAWNDAQKYMSAEEKARIAPQVTKEGLFNPGTGDTSVAGMLAHFNSLGNDTEKYNFINAIDQYSLGKGGANNLGAALQGALRNQQGMGNFENWYTTQSNKGPAGAAGLPPWLLSALQ